MSWYSTPSGHVKRSTKILIIGSGAGGAFSAVTLAEAGFDVLMVEKGHAQAATEMPKDLAESILNLYEEGGFRTSAGSPPVPIAGGVGLGGSTLVNSAICFPTPKQVLQHWNDLSGKAFSDTTEFYRIQNDVLQVMRVVETPDVLLSGNDKAHKRAAIKLGWKEGNIHRNTPSCIGCHRCNAGCPVGGKRSVDRALLPRAAEAGAKILAGVEITTINPQHALGICRNKKGAVTGTIEIKADIIICAGGSIATPSLLLNSGFGDANEHIGKGLHIHPVVSSWALLPDAIYARGATQGHYVDEFANDDVLLESNPVLPGGFFQAFSLIGSDLMELMHRGANMVSTGALIRDTSEGRVYASDNGAAKIEYDINEVDRKRLVKGLRLGAQIWIEGANATHVGLNVFGAAVCKTMDDVHKAVPEDLPAERIMGYSSHPQASCRIGRALDEKGKLNGSEGIYVMDASAIPSNVGRNPQISIMTATRILAERLVVELGGDIKPLNRET